MSANMLSQTAPLSAASLRRRARREAAALQKPYVPPTDHLFDAAFGWAVCQQGFSAEYAGELIRRIQDARRELDVRRIEYVPTADANDHGGTAAKVEALTS